MAREMLVGLNVVDDDAYQRYREEMRPILESYGGGFRYDFKVSDVLKQVTDAPINRVFTIHFRDGAALDAFFSDPDYIRAREQHFEASVSDMTIIATYDLDL